MHLGRPDKSSIAVAIPSSPPSSSHPPPSPPFVAPPFVAPPFLSPNPPRLVFRNPRCASPPATMRYSLIAALPALAAASPTFSTETIHKDSAPVLSSTTAKEVPNSYMVVFKKHVKDASKHHDWVQSVHSKNSQERMELRKRSTDLPVTSEVFAGLKHTYEMTGMKGYSGHFDDETLEAIRNHPDVSSISAEAAAPRRCGADRLGSPSQPGSRT